jgi:hypothetical protein
VDAARVILGHSSPTVTEIYAEVDREKAASVMERVGQAAVQDRGRHAGNDLREVSDGRAGHRLPQ